WTVQVTGSGTDVEQFNITTHIDKKSAAKLASHAFISSLDPTREDRVGLATYSYSSTNDAANQTSYICEANQWEGYFTVNTGGMYHFNLSWANTSDDLDLYLYDGITVLNASSTGSNPEMVSAALSPGTNYHVVVNGTNVTGNDTQFTIDVCGSPLREIMCAYYDSNSWRVPRYRQWDGTGWSDEASANDVGGTIRWIVMQACPTRNETIMGTLDDRRDFNVQTWDGSSWSAVQQFSGSSDTYACRGFDIAYERISGDAIAAYMDMGIDDGVPRYRVWDGSSWTGGAAVDGTNPGTGDIWWVRLAANPNSDEMVLVTLDDREDIRAQVWDGSSWGNPIEITDTARIDSHQCFDVVYDKDGDAMVLWADQSSVKSRVWDGTAWSAASDIYGFTDNVYWIKLASDPNSNNILMGALDLAYDISVSVWNGSAWTVANWEVETATHGSDRRYFDLSFEQASGTGMVVWSDDTHIPKYRTWNASDDSWSSEGSASRIGASYVSWVQLTPDPDSDEMFLMTSEGSNYGIDIQKWNGSAWGAVSEVETNSERRYECFDLTYSQQDTSIVQTTVNWLEWQAKTDNHLNTSIGSFDPIKASIESLTADGMTAIDEGLLNANNALVGYENGTVVLMTDGIDNAGYHSMITEAERAAASNTTIFTVGFGSDIDDVVLQQIANITGGEYYFAPNATVLRSIFVGIAGELGNYTAPEPEINIYIGSNTTIEGSFVNITYVNNSANVTYYDRTTEAYGHEHPSNPNMTFIEDRTILSWDVGNRPVPYQITVGEYWRVAYQLTIDNESANSVPVIISPSSITYDDSNGTRINETIPEVTVTVGCNATPDISTDSATNLTLSHEAESKGPPTRHPSLKPETITEYAYKLTAELTDVNESKVACGALVEFRASSGTLYNHTHPESGNDTTLRNFNETTKATNNGGAVVWLCSDAPGTITVWAYHTPENGTRLNASTVVTFHSCESPPIIPPAPEPRGVIMLE
ncbi:MAG TPA: VWA domain-containing protein, partial [Methanosarcinales archaeon]|nr:VWA domain-containing protein [Methanosarcinales archaeon]